MESWSLIVNSNKGTSVVENPMRIDRIVSVILNRVVIQKLAVQHANDVNAMANTLMNNLSGPVQRNIRAHEVKPVGQNLKSEINRRITLSQIA